MPEKTNLEEQEPRTDSASAQEGQAAETKDSDKAKTTGEEEPVKPVAEGRKKEPKAKPAAAKQEEPKAEPAAAKQEEPKAEPEAPVLKGGEKAPQQVPDQARESSGEPAGKGPGEKQEARPEERGPRRRDRPSGRDSGESSRPSDRQRRPGGRSRYRPFYRRKYCKFCSKKITISYRDADTLQRFITDRGKILPRRITGTCPKHQRRLAKAIKQARVLALLPFVEK